MPRIRYDDAFDEGADDIPFARPRSPQRRRERDDHPPPPPRPVADTFVDDRFPDGTRSSTYPEAAHGPTPVPEWVVTSGNAYDIDRGTVKTGKEADVDLVERVDLATGRSSLLAAKRYRAADHRLFHRDVGYLEGRRVRRSRETRAMANRTRLGRELIAHQWAATEFDVLGRMWSAGVPVPYPVQLDGTELLLEFIGDDDGDAAPRLAEATADEAELRWLWVACVDAMGAMGAAGFTHGDLSAYNILVDGDQLVLIDLPQVVDIVGNPQGLEYLARDCRNICRWFTSRGLTDADPDELMTFVMDSRMA